MILLLLTEETGHTDAYENSEKKAPSGAESDYEHWNQG